MKMAYVYCARAIEDASGEIYFPDEFSEEIWDRYHSHFDHIDVCMRKEKEIISTEKAKEKYYIFHDTNKTYIELPDISENLRSYLSIKRHRKLHIIIKSVVMKNDVVFARLPSDEGIIAINYAKKYNKPYLIEVVGCPWDSYWNHGLRGKLLAPMKALKMRLSVKNAKYAIYVTNNFLQNRYPCKGKTTNISNVQINDLDILALEKRKEKIGSHKGKIVLGTAAAVDVLYKGQDYVIKAISKLKEKGKNEYEYQLAGSGNQGRLKKCAEELGVANQIKFLGLLTHEEVISWLDSIDIYIQPSLQEGLPRAVIEAMSRGLLCIGSDCGGIPELLSSRFVIDRKKRMDQQIVNTILSLNDEDYINQANRNYKEANKYTYSLLRSRRDIFIESFVNDNSV